MGTITKYKHLGYYNEVGDIRELMGMSIDEIISYYKDGFGAFHEVDRHEVDSDVILEDEENNIKKGDVRISTDKVYLIVDNTYKKWLDDYADAEDGDDAECYIDIYMKYEIEVEVEELDEDVCWEELESLVGHRENKKGLTEELNRIFNTDDADFCEVEDDCPNNDYRIDFQFGDTGCGTIWYLKTRDADYPMYITEVTIDSF